MAAPPAEGTLSGACDTAFGWTPGETVGVPRTKKYSRFVIAHSQYQKCKRISIFLSMPDEIETEEIIKDIFQRGKTCFIPRYRFQSNHMDMVKLASPEEISSLPRTSWNIHQPGEDEDREEALSTGFQLLGVSEARLMDLPVCTQPHGLRRVHAVID